MREIPLRQYSCKKVKSFFVFFNENNRHQWEEACEQALKDLGGCKMAALLITLYAAVNMEENLAFEQVL